MIYLRRFCSVWVFLGTLPACNLSETVAPGTGRYSGHYNHQEVIAQVQAVDNRKLVMSLSPARAGAVESSTQLTKPVVFIVKLQSSGYLALQSNSPDFPVSVFKPISSTCFASVKAFSNETSSLELCWGGDKIRVTGSLSKSQNFELNLTLVVSAEMPNLEIPTRFKVSDLIERAKVHNFENRVEFEKVLEARAQANVAYMNLFPHGSFSDGLGLLSLNYQFVLRSVGDLAPFLLPSRWARAAEAKDLLIAEKQAWIIMDLDGMNITESLAEAARRDSEVLFRLHEQKDLIEGIRDLVRIKEAAGLLQLSSSDDLTSLVNQIEMTTVDLEGVQSKELAALSNAAGFYNPRAILGVDAEDSMVSGPMDSVQSPIQLDLNTALQTALVRSAELRQVSAMVQWAKDNRTERVFNWLDPAAEPGAGLGPAFPFYMEVGFHQIDEMLARKEQLKSVVFRKVSDTYIGINTSIQDYALAVRSKEIQARRVLRISQNLKMGINFVMSDLVAALQDQVRADLNIVNAEYGYLISLSRLNRLLYQGPYTEGVAEDKKGL